MAFFSSFSFVWGPRRSPPAYHRAPAPPALRLFTLLPRLLPAQARAAFSPPFPARVHTTFLAAHYSVSAGAGAAPSIHLGPHGAAGAMRSSAEEPREIAEPAAGLDAKMELEKAEAKLEMAKAELKMAKAELEKAEARLEKAKAAGAPDAKATARAEQEVDRAHGGVTSAHEGVKSAQELVSAFAHAVSRLVRSSAGSCVCYLAQVTGRLALAPAA